MVTLLKESKRYTITRKELKEVNQPWAKGRVLSFHCFEKFGTKPTNQDLMTIVAYCESNSKEDEQELEELYSSIQHTEWFRKIQTVNMDYLVRKGVNYELREDEKVLFLNIY